VESTGPIPVTPIHPCGRTPQAARLTPTLRHRTPPKGVRHQAGIVYG